MNKTILQMNHLLACQMWGLCFLKHFLKSVDFNRIQQESSLNSLSFITYTIPKKTTNIQWQSIVWFVAYVAYVFYLLIYINITSTSKIPCRQGQNHGCSCSRSVAVCLILLPRKCSDIKFCWLELTHQQATCCRESSSQQNFMSKHFLGNKWNLCVD